MLANLDAEPRKFIIICGVLAIGLALAGKFFEVAVTAFVCLFALLMLEYYLRRMG